MKTNVMRLLGTGGIVAAGALLAGCSSAHVGESWQCPLAQGTSCTTIAEADPAVPASAVQSAMLFGEPLHRARRQSDGLAPVGRREPGENCDDGCNPLAWLKGVFGVGAAADAGPLPSAETTPVAATEPAGKPDGIAAPLTDGALRVPEVLGRIWIAPFVDADGIYREAHWVRVVLEPAGWKLP